ncbi:hypothetical protein BU23DRAFT_192912 [Bimuria novae-zelandiae CBS 107.79]|uniref:Chitin-binding type-1 domain-containing protein n=1 Tax=Bimuria novae-zelandiae CBS 107.79 TaxID=1447943 RepID=A0A6A5VTF0_9PLEO|nr:hypothetical protein BU23DRAFT_192912 [Bimuria novae-zelandiae CBS 107.79]
MRTTAAFVLVTRALAAATPAFPRGNSGEEPVHYNVFGWPPTTVYYHWYETETTTEQETVIEYETTTVTKQLTFPPVTVTVTDYRDVMTATEYVPSITATVTDYTSELYDQSYGDEYELGDVVTAPATITETKTFTVAYTEGGENKISTTELEHEWTISGISHASQNVKTAWATEDQDETVWATEDQHEHSTSTVWVEPTPTASEAFHYEGGHEHGGPTWKFYIPENEDLEYLKPHKPSRPHDPTPTPRPSHFPPWSTSVVKPSSSKKISSSSKPTPPHTPQSSSAKPSASPSAWPGKLVQTPNGTCGHIKGPVAFSCYGNAKGECCSAYGHCGDTPGHCGTGCQAEFGKCDSVVAKPSAKPSSKPTAVLHGVSLYDLINRKLSAEEQGKWVGDGRDE